MTTFAFWASASAGALGAVVMICGGSGNQPLVDPGWPAHAAAIMNHPSRAAWWEGPPFGGGQWHAECRGDAATVNAALRDFARLAVPLKRVILKEGVGQSFWLNPNRDPQQRAAAAVDWTFMVWRTDRWKQLVKLPNEVHPIPAADQARGPAAELVIYGGGNVRLADLIIPPGLQVVDERPSRKR